MLADHPIGRESLIATSGNLLGGSLLLREVERQGLVGRILLGAIEEGQPVALLIKRHLAILTLAGLDLFRRSLLRIEREDTRLARVGAGEGQHAALLRELIGGHSGKGQLLAAVQRADIECRVFAASLIGDPIGRLGHFVIAQRVDRLALALHGADDQPIHRHLLLLGLAQLQRIDGLHSRHLFHHQIAGGGRKLESGSRMKTSYLAPFGGIEQHRRVALPRLHAAGYPATIVRDGLLRDAFPCR